jgi:nucleoid-associated protein YgaU
MKLRDLIKFICVFCNNLEETKSPSSPEIKTGMPGEDKLIRAQQKIAEGLKELLEVLGPSVPVTTIQVQPGQTLWGLALLHLGYGQRWRELFVMNLDQIMTLQEIHHAFSPSPDLIFPGQRLRMLMV